jgi:hypothetical protein
MIIEVWRPHLGAREMLVAVTPEIRFTPDACEFARAVTVFIAAHGRTDPAWIPKIPERWLSEDAGRGKLPDKSRRVPKS